jgi:hypothetical protein
MTYWLAFFKNACKGRHYLEDNQIKMNILAENGDENSIIQKP